MTDDETTGVRQPDQFEKRKSWADRNPKLSILMIAAVFYIILFGMCAFVVVLLLRG